MKKFTIALVVAVLLISITFRADATQFFSYAQPVNGQANSDWSFITAWNLSTGEFKVSADWYNGVVTFYYNLPYSNWVALFVYDDGTQQTRELCWSWCQVYVQ